MPRPKGSKNKKAFEQMESIENIDERCHRAKKLRKKCAKFRSRRATENGAHVL